MTAREQSRRARDRALQAKQLRDRGLSFRQIATAMGTKRTRAFQLVRKGEAIRARRSAAGLI